MNIYYSASQYASHLRAAKAYRRIIATTDVLVDSLATADLVIIHHEPRDYAELYQRYPALRQKYVVAYCVWEADELPLAYQESISYVQEVWTCSHYCKRSFSKHHSNVRVVPHVIERDIGSSDTDELEVRKVIGFRPRVTYFLNIALQDDLPRKNTSALIRAFQEVHEILPDTRLIIKTSSGWPRPRHPAEGVVHVWEPMRWAQINALYRLSSVYVSAHHAEGWGMTLSDAMIFEKPVVAPNYSGNLEYMDITNSFLIDTQERNLETSDCVDLFHEGMKWGYPSLDDLVQKLLSVSSNLSTPLVTEKLGRARESIKYFSYEAVSNVIRERLTEIEKAINMKPAV